MLLQQNLAFNNTVSEHVVSTPVISIFHEPMFGDSGLMTMTLAPVSDCFPERICDFLKVEQENRDYDLLLGYPYEVLASAGRISVESQELREDHTTRQLATFLSKNYFQVVRLSNSACDHLGSLFAE